MTAYMTRWLVVLEGEESNPMTPKPVEKLAKLEMLGLEPVLYRVRFRWAPNTWVEAERSLSPPPAEGWVAEWEARERQNEAWLETMEQAQRDDPGAGAINWKKLPF